MRKQHRHIVQEFGVAGFLCFYAFSPEKLLSLTNGGFKGKKTHRRGNRQTVQKSGSNRILQRLTKGLWSKILFFEPCKKKLMIVISSY